MLLWLQHSVKLGAKGWEFFKHALSDQQKWEWACLWHVVKTRIFPYISSLSGEIQISLILITGKKWKKEKGEMVGWKNPMAVKKAKGM